MSEAILVDQGSALSPLFADTGISNVYQSLRKQLHTAYTRVKETVNKAKLLALLDEIYKECNSEDWDGEGAVPLKLGAHQQTVDFVNLLPSYVLSPEVIPQHNGNIALEWSKGNHAILVISINGENRLSYAGMLGTSKFQGSEDFEDFLPPEILDKIFHFRRTENQL